MTCASPSRYRYRRGICRCDECRALNTDYQREYEQRNTHSSLRTEDVKARRLAKDPTSWMKQGVCRHPDIPLNVFFADEPAGSTGIYNQARSICNTCPVQTQCLAYAFRHRIEHGVWGGMSPKQRRDEDRRRRRISVRPGSRFTMAGPDEVAS